MDLPLTIIALPEVLSRVFLRDSFVSNVAIVESMSRSAPVLRLMIKESHVSGIEHKSVTFSSSSILTPMEINLLNRVLNLFRCHKVRAAGVEASKRPPRRGPGEVLHPRRNLPYSFPAMAVAGLLIIGAVGYPAPHVLKKPEADAGDVTKVATGVTRPEDTHPRK
ncbi:hypothetical protein NL676_034275 [Syzygium grande]|nr:hypothetical protein NL676_034275 [Syzygium grande]